MASKRQLALLKVLAAAAWADGRLDHEEVNRLKELMLRFSPTSPELGEIEALLAAPVSYARCEELTRDLLGMLPGKGERDEVLREIEILLAADGTVSPEETELLESLRGVMDAMTSMDAVLTRMSGVLRRVFGGRKPGTPPGDLAVYLKNTVLQRVDDLSGGAWRESLDPETLNRYTLFGAVLGRVAQAEGGLSAPERDRIRDLLAQRCALRPPLLDWTVRAVEEAAGAQLDRQALLSEFNRVAEHDERLKLLDAAFAVAAADGEVSGPELEELRLVSNYLWLTPREFHQIRSGWIRGPVGGQS
jgi:uncharacterized tellurite resistance protein B-like protein